MMTDIVEMLKQRYEILVSEQRQLEQMMLQAKADHDAYNGAIAEVARLLEHFNHEEQVEAIEKASTQ